MGKTKAKPNYSMQPANDTKTNKKQKWQTRSGKTFQKTFFTSVLTITREIPQKIKGKNPDKMFQLIFLKTYPQQQKQ